MMQLAIVIPAYNRPHTLARLLASLETADYPDGINIPLIISIDPEKEGANQAVLTVAESFDWQHGVKVLARHNEHLGLLQNFYYCGGLTEHYDAVIFLEDDSTVSPVFYYYAMQALEFFKDAPNIAGISLFRYAYNGYTHDLFEPLSDGTDIFFMQLSSGVGQIWSKAQWLRFQVWRATTATTGMKPNESMHDMWSKFEKDEHFPLLANYMVSTGQFYVFPRISLTTDFGDAGTHFANSTSYFQVPLQREQTNFRFHKFEKSNVIYDSFMEILPECLKRVSPDLHDLDFVVDLHATKAMRHLKARYVLTTRTSRTSRKSFALAMHPPEANILYNVVGEGIYLCDPRDLLWGRWTDFLIRKKLHEHSVRGQRLSLRKFILYVLLDKVARFKS